MEGSQVSMDGMCHWQGESVTPTPKFFVSFDLSNEVGVLYNTYAFRHWWYYNIH